MNFLKNIWNKILLAITFAFVAIAAYFGLENKRHLRKIKELDDHIDSLNKSNTQLTQENKVIKEVDEVRADNQFNPSEFDK